MTLPSLTTPVRTLPTRQLLSFWAAIAVARDIHRVLVPAVDRRIGTYEFLGRSDASGGVGGDLVDVVDDEERWLAYVADVSGHGVGPGVVMGLCKSAMRMRARGAGGIGPLLEDVQAVLMPLKPSATFVTVGSRSAPGGDRRSPVWQRTRPRPAARRPDAAADSARSVPAL